MTLDDSIIKALARHTARMRDEIEAWYDDPEHRRAFEEWLAKRRAEEKKTEARDAQI